ncbi:MAG: tetratricopeptide repeat protein [Thainema sp.]
MPLQKCDRVIDPVSQNVQRLNQKTYQQLRLALSLNLRRQILIAVCDDFYLRDHIAHQLQQDLASAHPSYQLSAAPSIQFVTLKLNLKHPDPYLQIVAWLKQQASAGIRYPAGTSIQVQIFGVEGLTRQSARVQREFLNALRSTERRLPHLDVNILLWLPRPWAYTVRESAPEFWRWRSRVFEFVSNPTPTHDIAADVQPSSPPTHPPSANRFPPAAGPSSPSATPPIQPAAPRISPTRPPAPIPPPPRPSQPSSEPPNYPTSNPSPPPFQPPSPPPATQPTDAPPDDPLPDLWALLQQDLNRLETDPPSDNRPSGYLLQPQDAPVSQQPPVLPPQPTPIKPTVESVDVGVPTDSTNAPVAPARREVQDGQSSPRDITTEVATESVTESVTEAISTEQVEPTVESPSEISPALPKFDSQEETTTQPLTVSLLSPELDDSLPHVSVLPGVIGDGTDLALPTITTLNPATGTNTNFSWLSETESSQPIVHVLSQQHSAVLAATPSTTTAVVEEDSDEAVRAVLRYINEQQQQRPPNPEFLAYAYQDLGNLYRDRIDAGDASVQTLTNAIQAYEQGLHWADKAVISVPDVLNDLGNLYWLQSRYAVQPEQAILNLQQSIETYQRALNQVSLRRQPDVYAMVQHNVGTAYGDLAQYKNAVEHLQSAVYCYEQALQYRSPDTHLAQYVATQNNLGTAYWKLSQHDHANVYLRQAVAAYEEALKYSSPDENGLHYAMIQNNLSTTYWQLAQYEKPIEYLQQAIAGYEQALQYRTLEYPASHASTQNNRGAAYRQLAQYFVDVPDTQRSYLESAIAAYTQALQAVEQHQQQASMPLSFDIGSTYNGLASAHHQLVQAAPDLSLPEKSRHLDRALQFFLQALSYWQDDAELGQSIVRSLIQVTRTYYKECGMDGQNAALAQIPAHLLPQILTQL